MERGRLLLSLMLSSVLAGACSSSSADDGAQRDDDLWARNNTRWPSSGATTVVSVCFEAPGEDAVKALVRDTIVGTWGAVAAIDFVGWKECGHSWSDLRVRFADERPHTLGFGVQLQGVAGGVTLNTTFVQSMAGCQDKKDICLIGQTIHELGHALGFLHEQDRADAPGDCTLLTDTPQGDGIVLGAYDPSSIMNYCDADYFTRPHLSALDIEGVRRVYGPRSGANLSDRCALARSFSGALCASGLGENDSATLLVCNDNRTVSSTACANGCRVNPPGQPDECNPTTGVVDPCARANGFNGLVCESALGGDPNSKELLLCMQNRTLTQNTCRNGCNKDAAGLNDACR